MKSDMEVRMEELHMGVEDLSRESGLPISVVQGILSGRISRPPMSLIRSLERILYLENMPEDALSEEEAPEEMFSGEELPHGQLTQEEWSQEKLTQREIPAEEIWEEEILQKLPLAEESEERDFQKKHVLLEESGGSTSLQTENQESENELRGALMVREEPVRRRKPTEPLMPMESLSAVDSPGIGHQLMVMELSQCFHHYVRERGGGCVILTSPLKVQLSCGHRQNTSCSDRNAYGNQSAYGQGQNISGQKDMEPYIYEQPPYVLLDPDIIISCRKERREDMLLAHAPDMVVEVTAPATRRRDLVHRVQEYLEGGVREYWIVDMRARGVVVYYFEADIFPRCYAFQDQIPVNIFQGKLSINMARISTCLEASLA